MPKIKTPRQGPPSATELGRQCVLRGISTAWLAKAAFVSESSAGSWRQGWRNMGMATATVLAAALKKDFKWSVKPSALLAMAATKPKE